MRWKIETSHKILKSGCRAGKSRLRTADRLANLISVFCIISWRLFWLTMINRTCLHAKPTIALTNVKIELLNCFIKDSKRTRKMPPLWDYLEKIAPCQLFNWRKLDREGALTAVGSGEPVVPASELATARAQISQLQRLLGKKTMENEILKEAVDIAWEKKWLLRSPLLRRNEQ